MEDLNQIYQLLLDKESERLEVKRKKQYYQIVDELINSGMVRADIHVEKALEVELHFMRRFFDFAISEFKRVINHPEADVNTLEKIYRYSVTSYFGKSLQRMLGILMNVRTSLKEDCVREHLEKLKSEALQKLETLQS